MYLKNLQVQNFRNYDTLKLSLNNGMNIIYGNNGQGKTNILESIYVLGMTKSHRSYIDNKLIKNDKNFFKICGNLYENSIKSKLEISLDENEKKLIIDNNIINKVNNYISKMNIIIFYPDDLSLIKGSPNERRRFLNSEISQLYSDYIILMNNYQKILKMRNDYLKKNNIDFSYLNTLTDYLIEKSIIIYRMRNKFIFKVNSYVNDIYKNLSGLENFYIKYKTNIEFDNYELEYLKEKLIAEFKKIQSKEIKYKITLIGPHRDDLEFFIGNKNIRMYGSQGQQRMAILSIKLSEIFIIKNYKGENPILLLDDVFSELDKKKKNNLLSYIDENIQTIITTTDLTNISKKLRSKSKLIEIENGKIKKITEVSENEK